MSQSDSAATFHHSGQAGADSGSQEWVVEPRGVGFASRAAEIWRSRHLLRYFAIQTIQRTYRRTLLGWPWLLIRPLFPVVIATFVFSSLAGIESDGPPYFLFFLVGMSSWGFFDKSLMWMTRSLQMNRGLLTKLYFPRLVLPAAAIGPGLVHLAIHIALILAASIYFLFADGVLYVTLGPNLLLAVVALVLCLFLALGIGFFTSVLGVETRDIRFTLAYVMGFWFFLTPVIYPLSLVPPESMWLIALNPMTIVVELFKAGVFGTSVELSFIQIAGAIGLINAVFFLGLAFFTRAEAAAVDRL